MSINSAAVAAAAPVIVSLRILSTLLPSAIETDTPVNAPPIMEFFCKIVDQEQIFFIMIWYPHVLIQEWIHGKIKEYRIVESRTGLFYNDLVPAWTNSRIKNRIECRLDFTQSFVLRMFAAEISIPTYSPPTVTGFFRLKN